MTGTELQIAFPKVDEGSQVLAVPVAPAAPLSSGLATIAQQSTVDTRAKLSCSALFQGETRVSAEAEARKMLTAMLQNPQVMMTYGIDALTGVNTLVDRLLQEMEPVKIPELTQLMRGLNQEMRGIQNEYDVSDPRVRERYENWKGGVGRFIGRAKSLIDLLMDDIKSIEKQIDDVKDTLTGKQLELMKNVSYYDELYKENELAIQQLIYKIGVMELIRDMAAQAAASVEIGDASLGDRGHEEQARLAEFASNMEIKIAEYKGRLWVAWATAPQVRMMRTMNVSLAGRINEMVCVTIPTMRMTIVTWRGLMQAKEAAEVTATVREASNQWLQSFAHAAAIAVPAIAEEVQTPTLSPETVFVMAKSIADQADGIVAAMERGAERRQELDTAMVTAKQVLNNSAAAVSDALIERVVHRAAELEISTHVA